MRSFAGRVFVGWLLWSWSAAVCQAAAAEVDTGNQPEVIETPEVFISATKTETPVRQVTSAVEIISGEQMQQRKMKTVVEALRLAQGLAVFQSGGPGTLAQVRMRGGTPQQTLVLIDGAIVNSATDGTYNFANLTTDNIERIEILRGSQGMMWGSDAMGGVVNIITKRGRETPNISAFAEYGSFATIREGASVTGKKGPVDVAATLSRWDTSNFSAINYRRGAAERRIERIVPQGHGRGRAAIAAQQPTAGGRVDGGEHQQRVDLLPVAGGRAIDRAAEQVVTVGVVDGAGDIRVVRQGAGLVRAELTVLVLTPGPDPAVDPEADHVSLTDRQRQEARVELADRASWSEQRAVTQ